MSHEFITVADEQRPVGRVDPFQGFLDSVVQVHLLPTAHGASQFNSQTPTDTVPCKLEPSDRRVGAPSFTSLPASLEPSKPLESSAYGKSGDFADMNALVPLGEWYETEGIAVLGKSTGISGLEISLKDDIFMVANQQSAASDFPLSSPVHSQFILII